MKILAVDPSSPLYGHVRPGQRLISVNGQPVVDSIDFRFKIAEDKVTLVFADRGDAQQTFSFDFPDCGELGLSFEEGKVRICKNNCIFCFVAQQPKGMRKALYVKDEDYRLSFTHGNFITLSNLNDGDIERIIEQRLSPLYVSVHTTDDELRRTMFRNPKLPAVLPLLRRLTGHGIAVHAQVVLCPGINDGDNLRKTVDDLAALYPGVQTLAVVPVGLTRYRQRLPQLRTPTRAEAADVLDYLESCQEELLPRLGSRFVWPADEFYVIAGRAFPSLGSYEDMAQFENGVGMARHFISSFNRRRRHLKGLKTRRRVLMVTGHSAHEFLAESIMPYLQKELGLDIRLDEIPNRFWGESVTVSGLLTGQDLLRYAQSRKGEFDQLVIPPNCLNSEELFLDNLPLGDFRHMLGREVVIGRYNLADTIREVCV